MKKRNGAASRDISIARFKFSSKVNHLDIALRFVQILPTPVVFLLLLLPAAFEAETQTEEQKFERPKSLNQPHKLKQVRIKPCLELLSL